MGINRGILAALVFLMTACGGNKAGTLTLKNNGGSPESAPITAGPTITPTATPVPVASVTPTPSSSVTPTPTPGGGPTPSVTPTPTPSGPVPSVTPTPAPVPPPASPTPNPVVTPTPPPGDWNNANNLSQAIFDIVELEPTPNHITYVISYYDIDHLEQKPADFKKIVKLSYVNTAPNQASAQFILTPNTPEFTNSSVQCQDGCKTGTIHLVYSGKAGSKLNGTADIDFIRKAIKKTQYELGLTISSDIRELKFIETLKNSKFFDGILTVFNVRNGFVQPYEVNMDFGLPADSCFSDNTILHGRKVGALKEVTYTFYAQPIPFHLSGFLGRANVSTDFSSFVELCFESPHSLKGFGAYTTSNPNPMGPCP